MAFLQSMRTELVSIQARSDTLARMFGWDEFTERVEHLKATIAAVDSGFLKREIFAARVA